ncbi:hypothetical protein XELAEV_18009110mg, partial [Xenopus laevis]
MEAGHEDIQMLLQQCQLASSSTTLVTSLPTAEPPGLPSEEAASSSGAASDVTIQCTPASRGPGKRRIVAAKRNTRGKQAAKKRTQMTSAVSAKKRIVADPPQTGVWPSASPSPSREESQPIQVIGNYSANDVIKSLLALLTPGAASTHISTGAVSSQVAETAFRDSILCAATPLGLHLPQAIKEKITKGEYIDMLSLLPSSKDFLSKQVKQSDPEMDRCRPVARTFTNWLQAFCIYSNVLCEKHPQLGPGLFKHIDIILEAYKAYGGISWFLYDDRFRQKMSIQKSISWGSKDIDLWMGMLISKQPSVPLPGNKTPVKYNACWAFEESTCRFQASCRYKHECAHCAGNHPAFHCIQRFVTKPSGRDP